MEEIKRMDGKKILPICNKPRIQIYTHHSYPLAIIESSFNVSDEVIKLRIKDGDKFKWITKTNDTVLKWMENNILSFHAGKFSNNTQCFIMRDCNLNDEIVIEIQYHQYTQPGSGINLILSNEKFDDCNDKNKSIYRFGILRRYGLYVQINEQRCNISNIKNITTYPAWLKVVRRGQSIASYLSGDGENWVLISEEELPKDFNNDHLLLGIYTNSAENQYYNWLYSNYIQTFYVGSDISRHLVTLDYYTTPPKNYSSLYMNHFLDFQREDNEVARSMFGNINNYIKWNLNNNRYIEIVLDEYYIPNREAFQKKHYAHSNLIYGYDDTSSCYFIIGHKGKMVDSEISYEVFDCAYNELVYSNIIRNIQYNPNSMAYQFDLKAVYWMINEYINGNNTSLYMRNIVPELNGAYGINTYGELLRTELGNISLFRDKRVSYLIYEHNWLMKQRLEFMYKKQIIKNKQFLEVISGFDNILHLSEKLKNFGVKNYMKLEAETEKKLIEILSQIEQCEIVFYKELINIMSLEIDS